MLKLPSKYDSAYLPIMKRRELRAQIPKWRQRYHYVKLLIENGYDPADIAGFGKTD